MADYMQIKDKKIPVDICSYSQSKTIKIYFKDKILKITKPKYVSQKSIIKMLEENKEQIYNQYINLKENSNKKKWESGEKISYEGENYTINIEYDNTNRIILRLNKENKILNIILPKEIDDFEKKIYIEKAFKKLIKNNTEALLQEKVPYWSQITNIKYEEFKVRDATTKYGSCMPKKGLLHFSSRLIMLPEEVVDAIIVHELCHITYANHSAEFYNLVKKYKPNYEEIDKWLKKNGQAIMF